MVVRHNTHGRRVAEYSRIQQNTAEYSIIQHNTTEYSRIQQNAVWTVRSLVDVIKTADSVTAP